MIGIIDLETTGLYKRHLAPEDPEQPHILQAAAILAELDGTVVTRIENVFVRPESAQRTAAGAAAVHGISPQDAARYGFPPHRVLALLVSLTSVVDRMVTYSEFDRMVVRSELLRRQISPAEWDRPGLQWIDVMRLATGPCALTRTDGTAKWPKLDEAHRILVGGERTGAHSAAGDAQATLEVYLALCARGAMEEAR